MTFNIKHKSNRFWGKHIRSYIVQSKINLGFPMLIHAARQPGHHGPDFPLKKGTNHRTGREQQDDDDVYATHRSSLFISMDPTWQQTRSYLSMQP